MIISCEAIDQGFDHLETVAKLHHGNDSDEAFEAVMAVQEWLGMDMLASDTLIERTRQYVPESRSEATRWVFMGYLIGLATAQYASESS